ncbi:MAG: hypothetical protein JOZ77_08245 [Candidatus Eremiobacteraeota bacterium]|nr:hypothetical protein [Candidatus Eremiobacteraeota bacterium]
MNSRFTVFALGCAFGIAGCAQTGFAPPSASGPAGLSMLPSRLHSSLLGSRRGRSSSSDPAIYEFQGTPDAANPEVGIVNIGTTLYGTTYNGGANNEGAVYSVTTGGSETVMHSFPTGSGDGYNPDATLTVEKGTLYGTTYYGGANGDGTIFSMTPSGTYKVLYSFGGKQNDCQSPDSTFTYVPSKDALYGVAYRGGANGEGCIFKYSLGKKSGESVLYSFTGGSNSSTGASALVFYKGAFYGTTGDGGANGLGAVFKVTLTGNESLVYSFQAEPDGAHPAAALVVLGNALYGTTSAGGQGGCGGFAGCGVIFKVTPGGKETVLNRFTDSNSTVDASTPQSALIVDGGLLYGTAPCTGPQCSSVLYSESPSGGPNNIVFDFISTASMPTGYPLNAFYGSPLLLQNTFYGTSADSARTGSGTVWEVPK